ncbi:putative ATP-dependent endonuclease of OLD family [Plasticicumulans lactativorans]|uniref:Putative ATP-dependent endonuclease of OLD family n=1 Tax=Plasticicumulans lactativorans TaxID=1133106 RepID=A0A4R2KRB8_9GAMM|nr:AAA family ATPase [Plasticicumulans lactativorans]TCO76831.1 putative ATP-dependent endonuclease of OLD family [Plasticicumulans lactativorans]
MRVVRIGIENFRGIRQAVLLFPKHGVLIGDNNTGKTTILEALDLVLGPDRLNRQPAIDEHDFFRGVYTIRPVVPQTNVVAEAAAGNDAEFLADEEVAGAKMPKITIEATIADLTEEQKGAFGDYIEFWNSVTDKFYDEPNPAGVDAAPITEALRVTFHGWYDEEDDDFEGGTYFTRSLTENDKPEPFSRKHKQLCGFLYLRSLRTASRALSLDRGSLLDIILRLKEVRPRMWENTLGTLSDVSVANDPALGISPVLESINAALKKYVPKEWGIEPHLKVSNLTREHLRKVITAFIATGDGDHAAPFYRQGTGTINMLVLAMLSQIAESKQNVIFAMEEPETAIPPYAQKRIVHEVRKLASQALFTSHSPYVLEEFTAEETVVLARDATGSLMQCNIALPDNVKPKRYRQEFRTRFCEGLLARRILIAEGPTEYSAFPVVCRRLAELNPGTYFSLEVLGICTVDADGETNIPGMAQLYKVLGKRTFAICDNQEEKNKALIESQIELLLMHDENGFEALVLKGTTEEALIRFARQLDWPQHLAQRYPHPEAQARVALKEYFAWSKGNWGVADFLAQCSEAEVPEWLRGAALKLKEACLPTPVPDNEIATSAESGVDSESSDDGTN